jgi:hypothetical protein
MPDEPPDLRLSLRPRVKVWFEAADGSGFGSGLVAILQAVERAGSIKRAADDLGRSYRHIWDRIKSAERALGRPLVSTQVGGQGAQRSQLTDGVDCRVGLPHSSRTNFFRDRLSLNVAARSHHPGGVNAPACDGSVHFFKDSIAAPAWQALGSRAGGEVVSADAF